MESTGDDRYTIVPAEQAATGKEQSPVDWSLLQET